MRNYTAESYKDLVEDIHDETMQKFMRDEERFIGGITGVQARTLVDLGAGYGRVLPLLSQVGQDVVAIEINPEMYRGLQQRASKYDNVTAIQGDFLKLGQILPPSAQRPIFFILQNSLGTIEGGDYADTLDVVSQVARERGGELVLSLLRQQALRDWGVSMYGKLSDMVGNVDMQKSDFDKGLMVTDTGYTSKWWMDSDLVRFRQMGEVIREQTTDEYIFLHLGF